MGTLTLRRPARPEIRAFSSALAIVPTGNLNQSQGKSCRPRFQYRRIRCTPEYRSAEIFSPPTFGDRSTTHELKVWSAH